MEGQEEQRSYVRRVVLPSGKTIEVVYFKETEPAEPAAAEPGPPPVEPDQQLHVCFDCECELVYPVEWEESSPESWKVLLHCPNCQLYREGVFAQDTVEAFDEELDRGAETLAQSYKRLLRENMHAEIDGFVNALRLDAVLPEDF
jgi:hypothetical protein